MPEPILSVCHLGPTPYREGLRLQESLVRARAEGRTGDWLLFPDHPPVLTVGRHPSAGNLVADPPTLERLGIEVFEVARGGDITWHGPGQLVGYLICDLEARGRDLHRFLRDIEEALIGALGALGVSAERSPGRTGVWTGGAKIASIGVAVRRWVSYHGFALNVAPDLGFFRLIHPCGLRGIQVTSLAECLGDRTPGMAQTRNLVAEAFGRQLGSSGCRWKTQAEISGLAGAAASDSNPAHHAGLAR